ncbi:fasciclin domain-containing protein [Cellulosilyticum ruminicola]|uniref:fasciclin domain-containing protein n=1 Tax=Cellulosilyticum ruminicola TaxID=425254 RepID=UPI0006D1808C|nr:fasciclin domain-containing protein [Cellulosilyticum ruminicola]
MKRTSKGILFCTVFAFIFLFCIGVHAQSNMQNGQNKNIVDVLKKDDKQFSTIMKALDAAGLTDTLKDEGLYTIFVPNNRAFEQLPKGALDNLLKPENKDQLKDVLTYHITKGKLPSEEAAKLNNQEITMLNGKPVKVEVKGKDIYIQGAKVLRADMDAKNGIIYVIDTVIMP